MYILFDSILAEYKNHYGEKGEIKLTEDLQQYLSELSKDSEIILITNDTLKSTTWLLENDLYHFVKNIVKPRIS